MNTSKISTELPRYEEFRDLTVMDYLGILWPDRSRRAVLELFKAGRLRSGGRPAGAQRRVGDLADLVLVGTLDDIPSIPMTAAEDAGAAPGEATGKLQVLHEDQRFVVLAKPSGVPVVPDRARGTESCLGFLIRRELAARAAKAPAEFLRYRIVHRIDRLTSGAVIVAKEAAAERQLAADFEERRVRKEYLAILAGVVAPALFTVNCPVMPGRKGRMRAEARGKAAPKSAVTEFEVLERFGAATLVRVLPLTGRTHQIRVHAWAAGHPLLADPLYGKHPALEALQAHTEAAPPAAVKRLPLHAYHYALPESWEEPRTFTCPLPEDLNQALASLRGGAPR